MVWIRNKKTLPYNPKTGTGHRGTWPEKKRMEVLTTFLATGSQAQTAAITGIPEPTIISWRKQDWWKERIAEMKSDNSLVLDNKLTKIMDKALEAVVDRIDNGEFIYDTKSDRLIRVPAKLRDVQKVASDMIDKKQLMERVTAKQQDQKQNITADHLILLAKEFAKFAGKKEAIDLPPVYEGDAQEVFDTHGVEIPPKS